MKMPVLSTSQIVTTVLLADDHLQFRRGLQLVVEKDGDLKVVGVSKNGKEATQMAGKIHPDMIVMDIAMPIMNGLVATKTIVAAYPDIRVLIMSAHPEPEYIHRAIICGASGYLLKQSSTHELPQAIREVVKGNCFFCTDISKALRQECQQLFQQKRLLRNP